MTKEWSGIVSMYTDQGAFWPFPRLKGCCCWYVDMCHTTYMCQANARHFICNSSSPRCPHLGSKRPLHIKKSSLSCYRCKGKHSPAICKFKNIDYNYCGKQGHIAKVCCSKERDQKWKHKQSKQQKTTHQPSSNDNLETKEHTMYHASADRAPKPLN